MRCGVPVLILAFNRPEQTRQVLAQIRLAAPLRLYAHCDGPRAGVPDDTEKVEEVRSLIRTAAAAASIELSTLFREENLGLRNGVHDALNWFFNQEEYGIILEDDCVPDPSLFPFCSELLVKYREDERIMHIGCSNQAEKAQAGIPASYVFTRFPFVWGWASWRRAWEKMDINLEDLENFERKGDLKRFLSNQKAVAYLMDKFSKTRSGENNSWAYAWFYSILKEHGLCIVPGVNLVLNKGIGTEGATNTTEWSKRGQVKARSISFPLVHPERQELHPDLEQAFFYATQKSRFRLWLWYALYRLGLR